MKKEFVPYEQALALKELGFNSRHHTAEIKFVQQCFGGYSEKGKICYLPTHTAYREVDAPTFSQAFRWFREKYKIECYINSYWNENDSSKRTYYTNYNYGSDIFYTIPKEFETHGEAELECLKKLIEIVKKQNK